MKPDHPSCYSLVLLLLGMGVFYLVAGLLMLYAWLTWGAWKPYMFQIAGIAVIVSIPITYLLWLSYLYRRKP